METQDRSFKVYGFKIEMHAGGRRVWPPSFKRFVRDKLDSGDLTIDQVIDDCNVSQSLVYKWRSDVKKSAAVTRVSKKEAVFSEVVVEEQKGSVFEPVRDDIRNQIVLRGRNAEIELPNDYPAQDLAVLISALESAAQ